MANSNPANIVKHSRYFKEGFDGYGLDQKVFEAQRDKWISEWRTEMTIQKYLDLGDQILLTGKSSDRINRAFVLKIKQGVYNTLTFIFFIFRYQKWN